MSRVLAISDLHVDFPQNMERLHALSNQDYIDDTLIIAGDISDSLEKLNITFSTLKKKFYQITFVPGNHELWVRKDSHSDSIEKFYSIQTLCRDLDIITSPFKVDSLSCSVWIVPLLSWYRLPEQDQKNSLFLKKTGENWEQCGWVDTVLCKWPEEANWLAADYFIERNKPFLDSYYDAPIISFSHFLPRRELIFNSVERGRQFSDDNAVIPFFPEDPHPYFNFTRVAGCKLLDQQIRQLNSTVHIYGHQHRNRNRQINGVNYISHCLGNRREQSHLGYTAIPKVIWENGNFLQAEDAI